jgi:pimeloyl-ACP methyl ester carboxylesterase
LDNYQKTFRRTDSDFISHGTRCAGWLYRPDGVLNPPVVVMAHGLAAERTFRLTAFAERFAENAMAAFAFDYRNFGDSDGAPRNLVKPRRQIEDWESAIDHVRTLEGIDRERIALWGSSFSGGHIMVIAARDPGISAIISQVPFVNGASFAMHMGLKYVAQAIGAGLRDILQMATFRGRYKVPVVSDPDAFAVLNTPECKAGYLGIVPQDSGWKNECPAAFLLTSALYRPTTYAKRVRCPALVMLAEKDSLIPPDSVKKAAEKMKNSEVISLPIGHFDIYLGEHYEMAVQRQIDFLKKHLTGVHGGDQAPERKARR